MRCYGTGQFPTPPPPLLKISFKLYVNIGFFSVLTISRTYSRNVPLLTLNVSKAPLKH